MPINKLYYSTYRDFETECSSTVNEVIDLLEAHVENALYVSEGVFMDITSQSGSPIDTPKTVLYGATKDSDNGHISYSEGIFTVNTDGFYAIKSRIRVSRAGASGISNVFLWAEASTNGGATWVVTGSSVDIQLDNSHSNEMFFDYSSLYLPAGTMLRSRFARSSTGNDSGNLTPSTPSSALQALGVMVSPSAQITIYKAY